LKIKGEALNKLLGNGARARIGLFMAIAEMLGNETAQRKYQGRLTGPNKSYEKRISRKNFGATGGHPGFKLIKKMTRRPAQPSIEWARAQWGKKASAKLRTLAARASREANIERERITRRKIVRVY
jgi:hypothetical protein